MSDPNVSLVHVVHKPTIVASDKPPLLVLLHGVGSNENDLIGLAPFLDGRFLIVSLRAPLTIQRGAYGWYELNWTATGITHDEESAKIGRQAAEKAIDELISTYDADPKRVYLMGFSQGAIISLGLILSKPEKFAGAVIMSGRLLPTFVVDAAQLTRLAGFPILVVHGTLDNVLPIQSGREIKEFLSSTPADLTYREYEMGHTVSQESLREINTWLSVKSFD